MAIKWQLIIKTCFIAVLDVTFFTVHGETGTLETFQLLCDFVKRS